MQKGLPTSSSQGQGAFRASREAFDVVEFCRRVLDSRMPPHVSTSIIFNQNFMNLKYPLTAG